MSRDTGEGGDVEVVGFSAVAKQFYKARGPQLHTPTYRGKPPEVDLLARKRGIEKYFETYGVTRSREKVSLAADLLEGDSGRNGEEWALDVRAGRHGVYVERADRETAREISTSGRRDAGGRAMEAATTDRKASGVSGLCVQG